MDEGKNLLYVGAGSGRITVWKVPTANTRAPSPFEVSIDLNNKQTQELDDDALLEAVEQFVSIPSVSANPLRLEDCRASGAFICQMMENFNFETRSVLQAKIPCILGKCKANDNPTGRWILVYGHHDVVCAGDESLWKSPPYQTQGREGLLFGRGVSDNKGPILAMVFATARVKQLEKLQVDVYFCFEGVNETHESLEDRGFPQVIRSGKFLPSDQPPEFIVLSNNTWISAKKPSLTYAMRGVVDVELKVRQQHELVSSHDGGGGVRLGGAMSSNAAVDDLIQVLASTRVLKNALQTRVAVPSETELNQLNHVVFQLRDEYNAEELIAQCISTSLAISSLHTSSDCFRKAPNEVYAKVSVHFVPGLTERTAKELVMDHFHSAFAELDTVNKWQVSCRFTSKWWVGDPQSVGFSLFARAIHRVWGVEPLFVRSGGSRDSSMTCFLEEEFKAHVVNFPMASSGDCAHQPNECIRISNLFQGRQIFEQVLVDLGDYLHV